MTLQQKKAWKVIVKGEIILEAATMEESITKAADFFITTGKNLSWSADEIEVYIEGIEQLSESLPGPAPLPLPAPTPE